jgi:hypothetical protein
VRLASRHVSVRLETDVIEDVDTIADLMTPLGSKKNRSTALRACILVGLELLKKQYAHKAPEPSELVVADLAST